MNLNELKNLSDLYTQCNLYKEHFATAFEPTEVDFYISSPPGTGINFLINLVLDSKSLDNSTKEYNTTNEYVVESTNAIWNSIDEPFQYLERRPIYNTDKMHQDLVAFFSKINQVNDPLIYAHVPPYNLVNAGHLKIKNFIHVTMTQRDYIFSKLMVYVKHQMQSVSVGNNNYFLKKAIEIYLKYAEDNSIDKAKLSLEKLTDCLEWTKNTLPYKSNLYLPTTIHFFDTAVHNTFIRDDDKRLTCMQSFDLMVNNMFENPEQYEEYTKLNLPLLSDVNVHQVTYEDLFFNLQVPDCMSNIDKTALKEYSIKNLELVEELITYSWDQDIKRKLRSMIDYYYGKIFFVVN
jgi:hypothetical protein